jgi:pSer/pThr/pTyr-binding forkhead associated (FHA) protein
MNELTFTVMRLGYLALLWVFVLVAIGVLRRDVATKARVRRSRAERRAAREDALAAGAVAAVSPAAASAGAAKKPTHLLVSAGSLTGTKIPLTGSSILIGRAPGCTLLLDDPLASSRHARVFMQSGDWFIEDLNSTNGTFIGESQVHGVAPLATGRPVRVGRTVVELVG